MLVHARWFAVVVLAVTVSFSAPVLAAKGTATTVKVALLDMSSIAGPGHGFGRGPWGGGNLRDMPRRGPTSPPGSGPSGQGPMGHGMMGPGWGWGGGTGPGWMAQRMMGPGMMGMGMMGMGMMYIRTSPDQIKAGKVRFEVVNYSASILHELEVVAVDDINAALPYDYDHAKVVVEKARNRGEVEDIAPGAEKVLELDLPAGNYLHSRSLCGGNGDALCRDTLTRVDF
jgi:hypothetical protein